MAFCCLLPLGKLVGGEGSSVIGWQRDQVVEDPSTLVIVVMMMMMMVVVVVVVVVMVVVMVMAMVMVVDGDR